MKNILDRKFGLRTIPLALLALCIVSFGLLIPELGIYWDDWEIITMLRLYELSEFWNYFSGSRPLAAWTYIIFGPYLGANVIAWHIFSLFTRWLAVVAMWWAFCNLWPQNRRQVTMAAFLFAVYPIFVQQPIAISYHQHWIAYFLYFISIGTMIEAVRKPRYFWSLTLVSLICLILNLATFEYFVGVELLRPVILWLIFRSNNTNTPKSLKSILKHWIPYLLILVVFLYWRFQFTFHSPEDPNQPTLLLDLLTEPAQTSKKLLQMILQDSVYIQFSSWYKTLDPELINLAHPFYLLSWVLAGFSAVGVAFYLIRLQRPEEENKSEVDWSKQALVIGVLAILLGALPVWATLRQVGGQHSDRFAMVSMFGASLVLIALLTSVARAWKETVIVLSVLIGLSVGLHLRTANDYRWSWIRQKRIYWQLYWRAPAIKPSTIIMSDGQLFPFVFPTFPFNLQYLQPQDSNWAYSYYYLDREFGHDKENWLSGKEIDYQYRNFTFNASSKDSLVIFHESPKISNCLWVLSPDDYNDPYLTDLIREALPISNLARIEAQSSSQDYPPTEIFGEEPNQDWCYLFQKAELAHQSGNWAKIVELGDEAINRGYLPLTSQTNAPHEWLPFIEAYAYTGHWDTAQEITIANFNIDQNYRYVLCNLWSHIQTNTPECQERDAAVVEVFSQLECAP